MSQIFHRLQPLLDQSRNHIHSLFSPRTNAIVTTTLLTLFSLTCISKCYTNYQEWLAMGPGGMPYNIFGWTIQSIARLFTSTDLLSTSVYTNPKTIAKYGALSNKRFIVGDLKQREGEPPYVPNFVAPQRQDGQASNEKIRELQKQLFTQIATSNARILNIKTSMAEKRGEAFFLHPFIPIQPWAKSMHGEIAHIHIEAEGSSHVNLSLADAKEVIEKGWGLRHRLSGPFIPVGYLFLYAPRNEEEVEVLGRILRAGVGFMSGGLEVA